MRQLKVELADRTLRFDGVSEVAPEELAKFLLLGAKPEELRVVGSEEDIAQFNAAAGDVLKLASDEPISLNMGYILPENYAKLDLDVYFQMKYDEACLNKNVNEQITMLDRIVAELEEVHRRGMDQFMRTIIYILDTFRQNNVVWGVGRGSSCACYLLFLVGLHAVDCVKMEVPMTEFFHE